MEFKKLYFYSFSFYGRQVFYIFNVPDKILRILNMTGLQRLFWGGGGNCPQEFRNIQAMTRLRFCIFLL